MKVNQPWPVAVKKWKRLDKKRFTASEGWKWLWKWYCGLHAPRAPRHKCIAHESTKKTFSRKSCLFLPGAFPWQSRQRLYNVGLFENVTMTSWWPLGSRRKNRDIWRMHNFDPTKWKQKYKERIHSSDNNNKKRRKRNKKNHRFILP